MKRVLLSAVSALVFASTAVAAATPDPAELPGGLSGKNIIHDTNSAFNGQTITSVLGNLNTGVTDAQTTANAAIPLTQKGAASGVAPLDANGGVSNHLASYGSSRLFSSDGIPVMSINPAQGDASLPGQDWWNLMKPHSVVVGGASPGIAETNDYNANGQIYIVGSADGVGGQGCLLCVLDTDASVTHDSVGLNTAWVNGVSGIASYAPADGSIEYVSAQNRDPVLLLDVESYTATQIILKTAMTSDQIARIHYGQYVLTNSVPDGSDPVVFSASSDMPTYPGYASVIVDVADSTHIDVKGWAVPGGGDSTSGQVPSISSLDTGWSNYGAPMVAIGGVTHVGDANWRIDLSKSSRPNSLTRDVGYAEYDLTSDYPVGAYNGRLFAITVSGNAPSADSFVFNINAPQYPSIMNLVVGPSNWGIKSTSFMFRGNGGVSTADSDEEMFEHAAFSDSTDNMRMVGYLHHLTSGTGVNGTEMYFGGYKTGTMGVSPMADTSGGQGLGAVGFGIGGNPGAISLCASDTTSANSLCSLTVGSDGNTVNTSAFLVGSSSSRIVLDQSGNGTFPGNVTSNALVYGASGTKTVLGSDGTGTFAGNITAPAVVVGTGTTKTIIGSDGDITLPGQITSVGNLVGNAILNKNSTFIADSSGNVQALKVTASQVIETSSYTLATIPSATQDGEHVWCSDCKLNSITGVEAYWHASASKWTDSQNNDLAN